MPSGIYQHKPCSKATKRKISEANKIALLGHTPWNKGLKGYQAGNEHYRFGNKLTKEIKEKISNTLKGKYTGKYASNWRGGIYPETRLERGRFKREMQKLIFERDGYKCQLCNSRGNLQVDHIQSWAEFKELRFEPDNCRTLCQKCHYKLTYKRKMPEFTKTWGHNFRYMRSN